MDSVNRGAAWRPLEVTVTLWRVVMSSIRFWAKSSLTPWIAALILMLLIFVLVSHGSGVPVTSWFYCLFMVPGLYGAYLSTRLPLIEISSEQIKFRDSNSRVFQVVNVSEIERVEWPGYDNIGIRLRSGEVKSISVIQLPREQWSVAISAIEGVISAPRSVKT